MTAHTERRSIAIVIGSPMYPSRALGLAELIERGLAPESFAVRTVHVRDLPAQALVQADFTHPAIVRASELIAQADGVIFASPVYKASYTGVLKAFIDLLPQFALRGKVILPLLVGGTFAHLLALDYALRPMLQSLDPLLIVSGLFVLDKSLTATDGGLRLDPELEPRMQQVTQSFVEGLRALSALRPT